MSPKIRIASSWLVGVLVCALAPAVSSANPLLSGYGGPGAGEQTIIGSALLNGSGGSGHGGSGGGSGHGAGRGGSPGGGAGSGGGGWQGAGAGQTTDEAGSAGLGGQSGPGARSSGSGASGRHGGSGTASLQAGGRGSHQATSGRPGAAAGASSGQSGQQVYVYPSALRSGAGSEPLGLSDGDLLLIGLLAAALIGLGVATVRVARLQR